MTTRLHVSCGGNGRPLSLVLTPGQRHESTQLAAVLDGIRVVTPGPGRPRTRPGRVIADTGYSSPRCQQLLRRRGIRFTIPTRSNQRRRRFDANAYRRRNVVERCVNRLKQFRGIATRYEKRAANFRAMTVIVSLMIWLGS